MNSLFQKLATNKKYKTTGMNKPMNYISFIFKTEKEATVTSEENVDILANI
jgi:hypothetical protein